MTLNEFQQSALIVSTNDAPDFFGDFDFDGVDCVRLYADDFWILQMSNGSYELHIGGDVTTSTNIQELEVELFGFFNLCNGL